MICRIAVFAALIWPLSAQTISLHPFAKAGKYGFMDEDGVVRIPATFDGALDFAEGLAPVAAISGDEVYEQGSAGKGCRIKILKWGYVDSAGNAVVPFRYSEAKAFSEGVASVRSGALWGFIDKTGKWVVQPKFDTTDSFHEGMAFVKLPREGSLSVRPGGPQRFPAPPVLSPSGFIDKSGRLVIPAKRRTSDGFNEGVAVVLDKDGSSQALIDRTGRVLVGGKQRLISLGEGLTAYADNDKAPYTIADASGKTVLPSTFESVRNFSESLAAVKRAGKWGFIDRNGTIDIPTSFDDGDYSYAFHEGLSPVYADGSYGYIDRTGKIAIAPHFASAGPFSGGLAAVCVKTGASPGGPDERPDKRCGFIDKTGAFVITPRFGSAQEFNAGWAPVQDAVFGSEMQINGKGKIVYRPAWTDELRLHPYGECHFPPPSAPPPPPRSYNVSISLSSAPAGASVFLVPLWDWQTNKDGAGLLADSDALASYLVTRGTTPLQDISVKAQVYMAVFDLAGKRKVAKLTVAERGDRQIAVSF